MRILEWLVPESWSLCMFGDNQEGNKLQYKKGYLETIEYIHDTPNCFGIHMGDEQEAYWIDDPRYDPYIISNSPLEQQKTVIADLKPLAGANKLIAMTYGNHSHKISPKVGDITKSTCSSDNLNVQYGGFSYVVKFIDEFGMQFKGFFTHGRKLIRTVADDPLRRLANEKLQLKQHLKYKMGDCLLMAKGHTHKLIVAEPQPQLYLATEEKTIHQQYTGWGGEGYIHPDHRWYINTGSFLKTLEEDVMSYSEYGEYDPIELGYAVATIENRKLINIEKVVV